jgi:hypothetical protein
MLISNFEVLSGDRYIKITGPAVQGFLTNPPSFINDAGVLGEQDDRIFDVHYVELANASQLAVEADRDETWTQNFFKLRVVAGGLRVFKTSKNENEAG